MDHGTESVPNVQNPAPNSILAQLRERRIAAASTRRHFMDVPGRYSDMLVAEYQPLAYEVLRSIAERADKSLRGNPRRDLLVQADGLAAACVSLHYRHEDGHTEPLTERLLGVGDDDTPLTYDQRLARALELEGGESMNQRAVVLAMFPDPLAIAVAYGELMEWQASGDSDDPKH
jgi:hypothetical protein